MGIFNFFKKKRPDEEYVKTESDGESTGIPPHHPSNKADDTQKAIREIADTRSQDEVPYKLFTFIFKYREYVVRYLNMMFQGNHSPIAAYEKPDGELTGYLFVAEDMSYNLSVEQVIEKMEVEFEKRIADKVISSWVIFYHSEYDNNNKHKVANESSKTRAISIKFRTNDGLISYVAIPYTIISDRVSYKGLSNFSVDQNRQILSTQLDNHKDYFQERVEIKPHIHENAAGIKIKKVNNGSLGTMWGGIFGFERLRKSNQILLEYMAAILGQSPTRVTNNVSICEIEYDDIILRGIATSDDLTKTAFPVIRSNFYIDSETKQIAEWENSNNLEAVISGGGRDTFGITYFATDYAENRTVYHTSKKLNVTFSGILFTLNKDNDEPTLPDGPSFAEGFVMYMPHKDLGQFGCYDFIGILEDLRAVKVLDDHVTGYILNIRLINNEEVKDFFTIPMFINKENMQINDLTLGMKISGAFQLQGEIKN